MRTISTSWSWGLDIRLTRPCFSSPRAACCGARTGRRTRTRASPRCGGSPTTPGSAEAGPDALRQVLRVPVAVLDVGDRGGVRDLLAAPTDLLSPHTLDEGPPCRYGPGRGEHGHDDPEHDERRDAAAPAGAAAVGVVAAATPAASGEAAAATPAASGGAPGQRMGGHGHDQAEEQDEQDDEQARDDEWACDGLLPGTWLRRAYLQPGRWYGRAPVMTDLPADWFNRPLAEVDPEVAEVLERRARAPAAHARDDRVGELRSPGRARLPGLGAHQQVRGGLSRQALLRRLRVGRHRGEARDRPRQVALRRRLRQRAAALRRVRPTPRPTSRCSSPATRSSASTSPTAAT